MNTAEVMALYNQFERKRVNSVNGFTVETEKLVKFVSNEEWGSFISYYDLLPSEANDEVLNQLNDYRNKGIHFEWKTYSTDKPSNMGELLCLHGFEPAETESFMALDLSSAKSTSVDCRAFVEVTDEQGIKDAITVQEQVWGGDFGWQYRYLTELKSNQPDSVSIYVIYQDGTPVTSAWITFNGDSPFAGIWGGSTIEAYRGKGYYTLLLNQRIYEAQQRGKKYLIIDASDMSKPIVEKHDFQLIATTTGYNSP